MTITPRRSVLYMPGANRRAMDKAAGYARSSKKKLRAFSGSPLFPALSAAADFIIQRSH